MRMIDAKLYPGTFNGSVRHALSLVGRTSPKKATTEEIDTFLFRSLEIAALAHRLDIDPEAVATAWHRVEEAVRVSRQMMIEEVLAAPHGQDVYRRVKEFTVWF